MSVFKNVRIYPNHGERAATITWDLELGTDAGDVYVAFSETGADGSWQALNPDAPVPSEVGLYQDQNLVLNAGTIDGYYRLLLTTDDGDDLLSESFRIMGDLTPKEYGIVKAMLHREFLGMRVTDGFPVWHCIPKDHGELADNTDPDTGEKFGEECDEADPNVKSYGLKYKGGFFPPVLTWIRVLKHAEGLQDDPDGFNPAEIDKTSVRMMSFPRPRRGHMIVDPTTDRRYLVTGEVKPYRFRGVIPIAFNATLEFLQQKDERYDFPMPDFDTKAYRKIPYWTAIVE